MSDIILADSKYPKSHKIKIGTVNEKGIIITSYDSFTGESVAITLNRDDTTTLQQFLTEHLNNGKQN